MKFATEGAEKLRDRYNRDIFRLRGSMGTNRAGEAGLGAYGMVGIGRFCGLSMGVIGNVKQKGTGGGDDGCL